MKTVIGDIWIVRADYKGIPTNGTITKTGCAVMGRGVALQAKQKFPRIDEQLGLAILSGGNHLYLLGDSLFSIPVKHNWWEKADVALIKRSVAELAQLANRLSDRTFAIPFLGTGNGKLAPADVWPLLKDLPDNVIVVLVDNAFRE